MDTKDKTNIINIFKYIVLNAIDPIRVFKEFENELKYCGVNISEIQCLLMDEENEQSGVICHTTNIGGYYLVPLGPYQKAYLLNYTVLLDSESAIKITEETNIDSNVMSDFGTLAQRPESISEDFQNMLVYLKKADIRVQNRSYMYEDSLNIKALPNSWSPYQRLLGLHMFQRLSLDDIVHKRYITVSNDYINADDDNSAMLKAHRDQSFEIRQVWAIYAFLLEVYYLQFEGTRSLTEKVNDLIVFINTKLCCYLEYELLLAYLFFEGKEKCVKSFFQKIQVGTKNSLKKIEGMAWDLFHIRYLPQQVFELSSTRRVDFIVKSILTKDKSFKDCIEFNPIKRIIKVEDNITVRYAKTPSDYFDISSINIISNPAVIDYHQLANELEPILLSIIEPSKI